MKTPLRNTYFVAKPWLPLPFRLAVRRWVARRQRADCSAIWPVKPGTERPPAGWPGWPGGKQFGLVLAHDVEGSRGLARCAEIARIEAGLGFKSSFYFVPEGEYELPDQLRESLLAQGFGVGVHDLHHDGKLFFSRRRFLANAGRINQYLKKWNATGFRAGFMLHNLDWLKDLNVRYDASTFDTDPFEPQPDGVDTIFPFWVPGSEGRGYVELPYTLPQDSTVFLLLGEKGPDIWKRKLDWVAEHGGMAMLTTHPDYMAFGSEKIRSTEYSISHYEEFLRYVRARYEGRYWLALPREVAEHTREPLRAAALVSGLSPKFASHPVIKRKVWIDLDNTPHIPFFEPIIEELTRRGYEVMVTARDAFQVCELADQKGLRYVKVGRHHGKNRIRKLTGLFYRALQLAPHALREKPVLGLSHGSRSQVIICNFLRIPTIILADYEHARMLPLMRPTWEMVPEIVPDSSLYCPRERVRKYPGIKEDVYVSKLKPDATLLHQLGLGARDIVVTARPPATEAHYHNPESEGLFTHFMERACRTPDVRVVLLPRNKKQGDFLQTRWPSWFEGQRTVIPRAAVDGLNLLWHSDLVVSGGGTMNREAAALGVPVYSIFRGKIGAVDHHLQKEKRLVLVESIADVDRKITLVRRERRPLETVASNVSLLKIVEHIEQLLEVNEAV